MDKKIIDMEVVYKSKWDKLKSKTSDKLRRVGDWIKDKPEQAAALGSVIIVGGEKLYKGIKKLRELGPTQSELDREWHDTHVYDRSNGIYYKIKRPMTAGESIEFSRRRQRGENVGDILMSMRLLKY